MNIGYYRTGGLALARWKDLGFLIRCPNCGERSVYEFNFGGEFIKRPAVEAPEKEWYNYVYGRLNLFGVEKEWWYHRFGCKRWFLALRNTRDNLVLQTFLPEENKGEEPPTR
jgi:sarcosine oxidase subunit delta